MQQNQIRAHSQVLHVLRFVDNFPVLLAVINHFSRVSFVYLVILSIFQVWS